MRQTTLNRSLWKLHPSKHQRTVIPEMRFFQLVTVRKVTSLCNHTKARGFAAIRATHRMNFSSLHKAS